MKKHVHFWAILILIGWGSSLYAQTPQPSILDLPTVIPPPADAAALGKYGDVPVSLANGSPDITIPIYQIKTPRLTLPITFNYNATGIKVDDLASWVGLEWSLNAGGMITRTINGTDDLVNPSGYYYSTIPAASAVTLANWNLFQGVMKKTQDSEPDYFFFNFGNHSGKFFFGTDKKPVIVNYQEPLQIQFNTSNTTFTILDDKGNSYYFGTQETNGSGGNYNGAFTVNNYITSWYLSKIVSNDRMDSITFSYTGDSRLEQDFQSFTETIGPYYTTAGTQVISGHDFATDEPFRVSYPMRLQEIDYKNGKTVFYSSTTRLDGASVKLDSMICYSFDYASKQYKEIKKLKSHYGYYISNSNVGTKPAVSPGPYRLRLDSLGIFGADSISGGSYKFAYDTTMLPYVAGNGRDLFGYYNGANSNTSLVPSQNVTFSTTNYNVGAATRTTNSTLIQAGILKSIVYPTGGYTNFTYEPNSYADIGKIITVTPASANAFGVTAERDTSTFVAASAPYSQPLITINITPYNYPGVPNPPLVKITDLTTGGTVFIEGYVDPNNGAHINALFPNWSGGHTYQLIADAFGDVRISAQIYVSYQQPSGTVTVDQGGGLRIKQTTDYDNANRFLRSNLYTYGLNECGYGTLSEPTYLFNTNSYTSTFGYMSPINNTQLPYYTTTRMIFTGSSVYDAFQLSGAPVTYQQVIKYQVDSLSNTLGKTVYSYNYYNDNILAVSQPYLNGLYLASSGWQGGQLLSQQEYGYQSGIYWPLKRTTYSYINPPLPQGRGLKLGYQFVYPLIPAMDSLSVSPVFSAMYYWFDAPIYAGSVLPATETTLSYDQTDSTKFVTESKTYQYDNLTHLQPTRTTLTESDGSTYLSIDRYPAEIDSLSGLSAGETNAIDSLQNQHYLTALLQNSTYLNGSLMNKTTHHYGLFNTHMALPSSVEAQNGSFGSETRLQFLGYDTYGNLQMVNKTGDLKLRYLWDYNSALPIAEIRNDPNSASAFTSFEADGTGGWIVSDTTRVRTDAVTGNMCYNLASKTVSKAVTVGYNYVVSYWAKPGPLTVGWKPTAFGFFTSVAGTAGLTKNGWTYYEHIMPTTTGVIQVSATTGLVDELRLFPVGALMKSYTYQPYAGITSAASENSTITYYDYDGLARLKTVRDVDKNAIKVYDYQYQVGPHTYYSAANSLGFTRNNCTSCQLGGPVTFSVPANMFTSLISQADANQQALNYLNANGQAYANANGSCTTPGTAPISASNTTSNTITVGFTNNCTGTLYLFHMNGSTSTNWNTVPVGTYTVQMSGGTVATNWNINGFGQTGTGASFSNISMNGVNNTFSAH